MKHEDIKELLPLYIDGGLDKDETEIVERHLAECEACRQELEGYQENFDFMTSIDDVEVSSDFLASVMRRVEEERKAAEPEVRRVVEPTVNWWAKVKDMLNLRLRIPVGALGVAAVAMLVLLLVGPFELLYQGGTTKNKSDFDITQPDIMFDQSYGLRNQELVQEKNMKFSAPQSEMAKEAPAPIADIAPTQVERKIIKTANLRIEIKDMDAAEKQLLNIINDMQGFVSHSNNWVSGTNQRFSNYQLRIPADGFYDALQRVEAIGRVKNRSLGGQDITEEYIDIESRLKNLKLQEERYRELLAKAVKVEDILAIERELERIRGTIESLQGQINYFDNRVSMSTIDVELMEPEPITSPNNWNIVRVLREALRQMLNSVSRMIYRLAALLPYILLALIGYWVVRSVWKRRKRKD